MTKKEFDQIMNHTYKFTSLVNARYFALRSRYWIVMGDDDRYWVTTPRKAEKLERAGYEIIK